MAVKPENRRTIVVAVLAALAPIIIAAAGWINAKAEGARADRAEVAVVEVVAAKQEVLDGFASYIVDRLDRDSALERVMLNCLVEYAEEFKADHDLEDTAPAQAFLDAVANREGYERRPK